MSLMFSEYPPPIMVIIGAFTLRAYSKTISSLFLHPFFEIFNLPSLSVESISTPEI